MKFNSSNVIFVHYHQNANILPVGRLALKDRKIYFEYDAQFLSTGLQLSPFKLPLKAGLLMCEESTFDGLFGVFNDSLPDGWGRLLLDRKLRQLKINPNVLTPLDRLKYVGKRGMGALLYEPEIVENTISHSLTNIDLIADECFDFQENDSVEYVDDLLNMNASSTGARPKILIRWKSKNNFEATNNQLKISDQDWIIKFKGPYDLKDIGSIEYAYHLMAKAAGVHVPEAKLYASKKCSGYFGVKRFDRKNGKYLHMHTISGLLHLDHRVPSLDYETIMKLTLKLTQNIQECENQFRNVVFNILSHNRDDHSKNFSFLMSEKGDWHLSPAYDLTFSYGPGGEHCTTIMGEGKKPTTKHLVELAKRSGILLQNANDIINQVQDAIASWKKFAEKADVCKKSNQLIQKELNKIS